MAEQRYSNVAIALHWGIAVLILGQIAGGIYMHNLPGSEFKFNLYQLHKSFGILALLLSILRLVWRLMHPVPALPSKMTRWEIFIAKTIHHLFYFLMIFVPIVGWVMVSASPLDIPTKLFGFISWPDFPGIAANKSAEDLFAEIHEYAAFAMAGLVILHVGAALFHHFKKKDDVLTRMLPFLKQKSGND